MTRATIQFFHGHFLAAFRWNPLVFVALCALSIFNGYATVVLATRAQRLRIGVRNQAEKKMARMIVIGALALNWIYLLSHWRDF
jgi:hypothetical protein